MNQEKLIPNLKNWRKQNGNSFSIEDWLSCEGNINLAIGFSFIFWPDFIIYENCILLKSHFDQNNFENWKKTDYVENYAQIENVINHIHILDLFSYEKINDPTLDQIKYLGNKLVEIYTVKLKTEFNNIDFEIVSNFNEDLEDYIDYKFSFFQKSNLNRKLK